MPKPSLTIPPLQDNQSSPKDLTPISVIRTETVLSRLPIHTLSKRGEVDIQISRRNERGEVDLRWEVSYSKKYGDARQLAYQIDTLIINRKIDELGRPLPKIIRLESLRQVCKELGLRSRSGDNTNALKKALHQNAGVYITAKLYYKTADGTERLLEAGFTPYGVVFTGERLPDGSKADGVYLILNDPYWEVLNNAPTRPLDYDYLKKLPPTAQRFYEIVSYKMFAAIKYKHPCAKLPYSEYCTFSAQQRYYDYDHVKKQMYKVHKPHLKLGYIQKISFEAATDSDGKHDWIMRYIPGPKARAEFKAFNGKNFKSDDALDQESVLPLETSEVSVPDDARNLVQYFHQRFHLTDISTPIAKELEHARALITQYGVERSRFIVEFSFEEAKTTNYTPKMFGGIVKYADAAIKTLEAREKKQAQRTLQTQEEQIKNRYDRYQTQEIDRLKSALSPHELAAMEDAIRAELVAEGPFRGSRSKRRVIGHVTLSRVCPCEAIELKTTG